jgi:hypothetical protein
MPQDSTVEQLKKSDESSSALQSNPSLTALYNSHSNKGSDTTLSLSNSAVFTNGEALVQKGTVAHVNNPIKKKNVDDPHAGHEHYEHYGDEEDDGAFELNWTPKVSSDNHTSGNYNKI